MKRRLAGVGHGKLSPSYGDQGMSLIEAIIAMMLLVAFLGVFVAVTEFTSRFMRQSESGLPGSQGVLVDQHALQLAMDQLAEILTQPAFTIADLRLIQSKGCVDDPTSGSMDDATTPGWGLPGRVLKVPSGYKFCLRFTSMTEPSTTADLLAGAKPGIYVIQAIPNEITAASVPARRLFCRPKPFC